jgi:DNA repair protein RecN (Recombination protein N)
MLSQLQIKNYALIKHLELEPDAALSIITGETGAGKSILLGALGLIMGNRADIKTLYDESEKCIIEAQFEISDLNLKDFFENQELDYEPKCLIRREISPQGKSRAFINDTPVTLETLKELGLQLMDIHSQHDTLSLANNQYQLKICDAFAENNLLLEQYKSVFKKLKLSQKNLVDLQTNALTFQKELDYNSFQLKELEQAKLADIQHNALEQEQKILENADEVKRKLQLSIAYLSDSDQAAVGLIAEAGNSLNSILTLSDTYKIMKDRLTGVLIEIKDICSEIESLESKTEADPNRLDFINEKLNALYKLQQKHGLKTIDELIELQNSLQNKVNAVENLDEHIAKLKKEIEGLEKEAISQAEKLTLTRTKAAKSLETEIQILIKELGMPEGSFGISLKPKTLTTDGADEITFAFSANKGMALKPLKEVASGGEFSRVMLALKYSIAKKTALPTIIFDEIDTGISGEVANKVGRIMQEMAQNMQVITITHLHQIAGKGNAHFFVYKDNSADKTVSTIKKLTQDQRIIAIAQMIGGENPSESAIQSAIELLQINV